MVSVGMYALSIRNQKEFRDFVCTRLQNVTEIQKPIATTQAGEYDKQWHNIISIELAVHPT